MKKQSLNFLLEGPAIRGAVTPVGGIKEIVLAAHRTGDVPTDIRDQMRIGFVENVNELKELVLGMHDFFVPLALPAGLIEHSESVSRERQPWIFVLLKLREHFNGNNFAEVFANILVW